MPAVNLDRVNAPQAFVSSFAPRMRTYGNSLLTPVIPQTVLPPVRTTKRGTTAINYAEEFDEDSVDDSDGPRRPTGLRTNQQKRDVEQNVEKVKELGKEAQAPVEIQGIWRDWMGKPKRVMTEKQVHVQSALPTTLVPIRIDLDIAAFKPEPALPTPNNARDFGIDENLPAYKAPDVTPPYRLKDTFMWNLHEALYTPDMFAKIFVDELDFPIQRKQAMVLEIAGQIRQQLEEHATIALHPLFQPENHTSAQPPTNAPTPSLRPDASREDSSTPLAVGTPNPAHLQLPHLNGLHGASGSSTPRPNGMSTPSLAVTAQPLPQDSTSASILNPPDSHRCVITLSINLQNRLFTDKFEWSLLHPPGFPEIFARQTCADLGLAGEWVPNMSHAIYEATMRLKKDMIDNGGSLAGVVGSGVDGWGVVENEACEYHGTAESAIGVGAGWRFDEDGLGADWEPKIEMLSKEEIEKREGDRERQIRRQRRETARFTTNYTLQAQSSGANDYFAGGLGSSQQINGEDERMGRGERSKKKRRFRSLSPVGRETPEAAGFGGTSSTLTDGERQYWSCSHCSIWGTAVWGVRDGPAGSRVSLTSPPILFGPNTYISLQTLCSNCGLLYERDKKLPPWNHRLFATERPAGARESQPQAPAPTTSRAQSYLQSDFSAFPAHPTPISTTTHIATQPNHYLSNMTSSTPSRLAPRNSNPLPDFIPQPSASSTLNPAAHLYTGHTPATPPQISASTLADIVNYAEPGEDLDWTKIAEPRERKRLQNIINGRKYRERRLAAEGMGGSGGNYPGASGVGSTMSMGYGARASHGTPSAAAAVGGAGGGAAQMPVSVSAPAGQGTG